MDCCCMCRPMVYSTSSLFNATVAVNSFGTPLTICSSCYEGARGMVAFLNELDCAREPGNSTNSLAPTMNSSKGISNGFKWMKDMKEKEGRINEKLEFLHGFVSALHEGIHTDILLKAGNGSPIPAHKAVLATRSEIFKTMLGFDECKAPAEDTITLPELSYEELHCLLDFLYCGNLSDDRAVKHSHSLLVAADKYNIPFLKKFCEHHIIEALGPSNVLEVLELSELASNEMLKKQAMKWILKHVKDVVFSAKYEAFALKNSHLCVEITRALLMEMEGIAEPRGGRLGPMPPQRIIFSRPIP